MFNLPDLINRFAQGSNTPGQKIEVGLPNIEGEVIPDSTSAFELFASDNLNTKGAFGVGYSNAISLSAHLLLS